MGEIIHHDMLEVIPELCQNPEEELIAKGMLAEDEVDSTYQGNIYLSFQFLSHGLTDAQAKETATWLFISKDLEYMGDAVVGVCWMASKLNREGRAMPTDYWKE